MNSSSIWAPQYDVGNGTIRRRDRSRRAQTSRLAGFRDCSWPSRYDSVRPVSRRSSTTTTWRPAMSPSRSLTMRTRPESGAKWEMAMKSTSQGTVRARTRSERKNSEPLRTPMRTTPSGWARSISAASRLTVSATPAASIHGLGAAAVPCVTDRSCPWRAANAHPEHRQAQRRPQPGQLGEGLGGPGGGGRILGGGHRHRHLGEERRLLLGEALVHPEVAGLDAVAEEPGGDLGHGQGLGAVALGPFPGEQAERLQLGQGPLVEAGLLAQVVTAVADVAAGGPQLVGPGRGGGGRRRRRGRNLGSRPVGRDEPDGVVVGGGGRGRFGQRER